MTHWTNRPDTLTVFGFKVFDPETREMQVVGCKATLDAIGRLGLAEPVPGTAEDVPLHAVDPQGRYRRVATGWGALD
jgi:hypothetical protein